MLADKSNTSHKLFSDFILSLNDDEMNESAIISFISQSGEINFYSALNAFNQNPDNLFYYSIPEQDFYIAATGESFSKSFENIETLNEYSSEFTEFKKRIIHNFDRMNYYPPLFLYAAKFPSNKISEEWTNFAPVKIFMPELILIRSKGKYFNVVNVRKDSEINKKLIIDEFKSITKSLLNLNTVFDPDNSKPSIKLSRSENIDVWKNKVNSILTGIRNKEFEKIVLSRSTEFGLSIDIEPSQLAFLLDQKYPECFNFIYKVKDATFFSASPEKLFILKEGEIHTEALAGSIERGNNDQEDKSFESTLIKSSKDADEHIVVIDHLKYVLNNFCQSVIIDKVPSLKKLSNIQHLHTTLIGRLKNGLDVFAIIKDIFPTPAVGGYPVIPALKVIDEIEDFDRGLFTGFIGWMNLKNDCEFVVSIRSGLINKNKLYVYAGCGIVPGSDPEKEYEETQLKAEAIISLFNYENKS
ncbi:MAG: isochorismate synthase [Ignavibacteriaceae bacterium]